MRVILRRLLLSADPERNNLSSLLNAVWRYLHLDSTMKKHNSPCDWATILQGPKPPEDFKKKQHQQQQRTRESQMVQTEIAQFEANKKKGVTFGFASSSSGQPPPGEFPLDGSSQGCGTPGRGAKLTLQSNSQYLQDIQQRLKENSVAREQRAIRLDRFLEVQLKARKAQEEVQQEEQLMKRLAHRSQQEQRLAAQLLQIRRQKEVIRENRMFREKQYQQQRERDFQEALEVETALARQDKLERAAEIRKELELCERIARERAQRRHEKYFESCKDIVEQIVDLVTKMGEYRLLSGDLIPEKLMREWKELLFSGLPLYERKGERFELSTSLDPVDVERQEILNNQDYDEYANMVGEWAWPEEAGQTKSAPTNNNILGHDVVRMRNIVHQVGEEPSSPFPQFTFKACVLGKFCSGKTTCLAKIAKASGICVLSPDTLIKEALNAYQNGEEPSSFSMKGAAAEKELKKGNAIPNELLVEIMVEAIRQLPAQSGWIMDGFPLDITQAHLLEKAMGGSVDEGTGVKCNRANLAADLNPPEPPRPPAPVLDLVLLLDIPDESVVRHAFRHTDTGTAAAAIHSPDKTLYLAQTQDRIVAFQDTWPKLEEWFDEKQNILVRVDADVDEEELCKRVESVLQRVMMQTQQALASPDVVLNTRKASDSSASATPVDQLPDLTGGECGPTERTSSRNEEKTQREKTLPKFPTGPSNNSSTSLLTSVDSQGVTKTKNLPKSTAPCPGSANWVYVNKPLPPEIPKYLCSYWDAVCDSYRDNIKTVMQQLRSQRTVILHRLYNIREEYKHFLGRPDLKQEFVTQWQKDFNSIPDDMREDEETKGELHLRLDELCEYLWNISDKRKEEDEQESSTLMGEGWLEEHAAVLVNHHSMLMQVELERFQATLCLLRVYYSSMSGQVPSELPSNFVHIRLLETSKNEERNPDSSGAVSKKHSQDQTEPAKAPHNKLILDYQETIKAISKLISTEVHQEQIKKQTEKVQETETPSATSAVSPPCSKVKKKKASDKKKGKQSQKPSSTAAPAGEKVSVKKASDKTKGKQSQKPSSTAAPADENVSAKKVSDKKKGQQSQKPPPSPEPADEKVSEKNRDGQIKNRTYEEYSAALHHEENAAKVRIALVKGHGQMMVQSLHSRAEQTLSSMQKWLEACYLAQMKSIDQLPELIRHHIEAGAKLQNELVLEGTDFYLNGDCHMVAPPPCPPRPPPLEKPSGSTPTITQLESLRQQFCTVAPSGFISSTEFSSFLNVIISVNKVGNTLPTPWSNTNQTQLLEIGSLFTDSCGLIDWRRFLLSAALPWPFPSLTQLLDVLQRFKAADTADTGYINEKEYLQTELWFSNESIQPVSEDPSEPLPFDRLANLRKFFFKLFADDSLYLPRLDYVSMLQYFAADPNTKQGFIRALSVVLGHLSPGHLVKSMVSIEEALSSSEPDGKSKEEEELCGSSTSLGEQEVSISALLAVICPKVMKMKDNTLPSGCLGQKEHTEHLVNVFRELDYKPGDSVPFSVLSRHPFIQSLMKTSAQYQLVNIHRVLLSH